MKKLLAFTAACTGALVLGMSSPASAGVVPHVRSETLIFPTTDSLSLVSVTKTALPGPLDPKVFLFGILGA